MRDDLVCKKCYPQSRRGLNFQTMIWCCMQHHIPKSAASTIPFRMEDFHMANRNEPPAIPVDLGHQAKRITYLHYRGVPELQAEAQAGLQVGRLCYGNGKPMRQVSGSENSRSNLRRGNPIRKGAAISPELILGPQQARQRMVTCSGPRQLLFSIS